MATSKRLLLLIIRCATVVVAVSFLAFYVAQSRIETNTVFASSKSSIGVNFKTPATTNSAVPQPSLSLSTNALPLLTPPDSSPPVISDILPEETPNPFSFGLVSQHPTMLGGSKAAPRPIVETSLLFRSWTVPAQTTSHTFGLPPVRELPPAVTFGKPVIQVQPDPAETAPTPAPTPTPLAPIERDNPAAIPGPASTPTPTPSPTTAAAP